MQEAQVQAQVELVGQDLLLEVHHHINQDLMHTKLMLKEIKMIQQQH